MFGLGNRDRNQTFDQCWSQLPFGYKFLFLFTLIYNGLTLIFPFLLSKMYFNGYLVISQFQIWRLLIPFIPSGVMPAAILNILINYLWLLSIYPPIQKRLSTSYILLQTFFQNLLISLIMCILTVIFNIILSIQPKQLSFISYGMFPLIMIFMWKQVSQNPQQYTTFCCMPCLIKMKYIPLVMLGFCLILATGMIIPLIIAFGVGYIQFMYFKRRIIRLPLKVYKKIDMLLPKAITSRYDYVKVVNVENMLAGECLSNGSGGRLAENNNNRNPFNRNNNQNNNNQQYQQQQNQMNKVQVIGTGVSIGGGQAQNFRGFWAKKADEINKNNQQIQIQPNTNINSNNKNTNDYYKSFNNTQIQSSNQNKNKNNNNKNNNNNQNQNYQNLANNSNQSNQLDHHQYFTQHDHNNNNNNNDFNQTNDSLMRFKLNQEENNKDKQSQQELQQKDQKKQVKINLLE